MLMSTEGDGSKEWRMSIGASGGCDAGGAKTKGEGAAGQGIRLKFEGIHQYFQRFSTSARSVPPGQNPTGQGSAKWTQDIPGGCPPGAPVGEFRSRAPICSPDQFFPQDTPGLTVYK